LKDIKYIVGLTIIVLTFLVSIIPFLITQVFPFFFMGVGFVWFSRVKVLTKVICTVLPVLLWVPFFNLFIFSTGLFYKETAQKVDFNFPENFEGKAIVVQQISCGQEVTKKNGREQLNFPENEILLYQGSIEKTGYRNHHFYYLSKGGIRTKIDEVDYYSILFQDDSTKIAGSSDLGIWYRGTMMETDSLPYEMTEYELAEMFVYTLSNIENFLSVEYNKKVDSLIYEAISRCK
jgi:energy-coupling factor transporter transmembrane protein EcfT